MIFGNITIIRANIKLFDKHTCHFGLGHSLINQLKQKRIQSPLCLSFIHIVICYKINFGIE